MATKRVWQQRTAGKDAVPIAAPLRRPGRRDADFIFSEFSLSADSARAQTQALRSPAKTL